MQTEVMDSSIKKTPTISRFFAWLLIYWWVPVCATMLYYYGIGQKEMEDCIISVSVSFVVLGTLLLCESALLSI